MNEFLRGAVAVCCVLAGVFFLKFWTLSRDRLLLFFCTAFWIFALNWTLRALDGPLVEYLYVLRFLAFALIAAGIIDKNYRSS
jgi:hypothetical protein